MKRLAYLLELNTRSPKYISICHTCTLQRHPDEPFS